MTRFLAATLLVLLTAAPALAHPPATLDATEKRRMAEAVQVYLAHEGSPCAEHLHLVAARWIGDWARVTVACKDADDAFAFLKRDGRGWKVASLGTGWAPAELAKLGVPRGLR